jgi:uncharacterized protein (DUF2147 family)
MMKHIILSFLILGCLCNIQAQASSDQVIGIWFNEDKTNQIEIYKVGDTYSGKIVWLEMIESNPSLQPKDKNNPKPELRKRDILGLDIITGLKHAAGKWINGTIYTPKRGIYADCEVQLLSDGRLKIIVSKSGFTRVQIWTRK